MGFPWKMQFPNKNGTLHFRGGNLQPQLLSNTTKIEFKHLKTNILQQHGNPQETFIFWGYGAPYIGGSMIQNLHFSMGFWGPRVAPKKWGKIVSGRVFFSQKVGSHRPATLPKQLPEKSHGFFKTHGLKRFCKACKYPSIVFQPSFFRCYVSFREGNVSIKN